MKYCFILWTRPEIIKLYSSIKYCKENNLDFFLIHTNQHYSENMDKVFFEELWLESAKYNLWINWGNHWEMTWKMMIWLEEILTLEKPNIVFVQWDTNTVLAWALVASKLGIPVVHIEAWLRSYDNNMPEEINRIVTDHISSFLFCPTQKQKDILLKEGISEDKIFIVGNTIVDSVYIVKDLLKDREKLILDKYKLEKNDYILLTIHRPSNVDNDINIEQILKWINYIQERSKKKIIFPIHPRTKKNIYQFWLEKFLKDLLIIEPVWFFENIALESNSYMIVTDSWWIQEEWCILQKKTLILRENTERPETLDVWGAMLVWNSFENMISWFDILENKSIDWYNPFGDGKSAEKIFNSIKENI